MSAILLVHGTGVRSVSYDPWLRLVQSKVDLARPGMKVLECKWGDKKGVRFEDLKSVPDRAQYRDVSEVSSEDHEIALWSLLYDDPLLELRSLVPVVGMRAGDTGSPAEESPASSLRSAVDALRTGTLKPELEGALARVEWSTYWPAARRLLDEKLVRVQLWQPGLRVREAGPALARALVAALTVQACEAGMALISGEDRDELVRLILLSLGQSPETETRGILDAPKRQAAGLLMHVATWYAKKHRVEQARGGGAAAGDVLLYQVRGDCIRKFIADAIDKAKQPVYLLSHSLGGIACLDLLISQHIPAVKGLITAGSQGPLLYELGALWSLTPPHELPEHFPPWLNIFDPNDLLSYMAKPVFPNDKRIHEEVVWSRQPALAAHSAYWNQSRTWSAIWKFVEKYGD